MPLLHEFFGKVGNDAFCAPVELRRHAFVKWSDLSDPHGDVSRLKASSASTGAAHSLGNAEPPLAMRDDIANHRTIVRRSSTD